MRIEPGGDFVIHAAKIGLQLLRLKDGKKGNKNEIFVAVVLAIIQ